MTVIAIAITIAMLQTQVDLAKRVITHDAFHTPIIRYIAGLDIGFVKNDPVKAVVGVTIMEYPTLKHVFSKYEPVNMDMEYVSGFLAFREVPHYQRILSQVPLEFAPDLLMVDGNGILHTRRCGIASHLGVILDIPSIGVAKTLYNHDSIHICPRTRNLVGQSSGTIWGHAVNEKSTRDIYVSIGHRISLDTAVDIVKKCCIYRIPEPIRLTDNGCREYINRNRNRNRK